MSEHFENMELRAQAEYDGSTDGMNLLIDRCELNRDDFQIMNIDPVKGESTNKWTGHIMIHQFSGKEKHSLSEVYLKPGDYYIYKA